MNASRGLLVCLVTLSVLVHSAPARTPSDPPPNSNLRIQNPTGSPVSLDNPGARSFHASAVADTTILGYWDFDNGVVCETDGWVSLDITAQEGTYFHVDDFAGLAGGDYGRLNPLQGNQSLWCGARPDAVNPVLCGYAALPGYGNSWWQLFCTASCLNVIGAVSVDYLIAWDSEPAYDATYVEYDLCDDNWTTFDGGLGVYDGVGSAFASSFVPDSLHSGMIRFRFQFASDGAWSDEDGLWDTDGGVILDSLTVNDAGGAVLPAELFETEAVGATQTTSGNWIDCNQPGYGDFAAVFPGASVLQGDDCVFDASCLWAFFSGSTATYACGGFPGQAAIPFVNERGQYINNEIWSPRFPFVGSGNQVTYQFDVYRDLPLNNLIFFVWHIRSWIDDCPGRWQDRNFVFFGNDWLTSRNAVGDLIETGAQELQVALGTIDMCPVWCGVFGTGACHSQGPLFDNVTVYRIDSGGPQWSIRDIDLFQDNFAGDGTLTGTVRADMALDILPSSNPFFVPGDSTVVTVDDPDVGLRGDPYTGFGAAVYTYVSVWPQNQAGKSGSALTNDAFRYPVVDSLTHDGNTWYCIRMDTSFTDGTARSGAQPDRFCIDLNDNLFTPCDTICFVFYAVSDTPSTDATYYTQTLGATTDQWKALSNPMEFTCLPAGGWKRGGDILYVDGMNARGAQPFFDTAFDYLGIRDLVDRYDIRGPSSNVANRPGARVVDVFQQIMACYRKIIWNTGDLSSGTVGDGTGNPEKSDDAFLLFTFIDQIPNTGGIYFSGDDLASELAGLSGPFVPPLLSYINYTVVNTDHQTFGLSINPLVIGGGGSCFDHVTGPDTLIAWGGCPLLNDFDVISPTGPATLEASYHSDGTTGGAIVGQITNNTSGFNVGILMSGFSYHYIRDDRAQGVPERAEHLYDILTWLGNVPNIPVAAGPEPYRNSLAQNYPNPFNPTTTIHFTVKERARVSLKVYNVAGQQVATLVNDTRTPGVVHTVDWNGRNDAGQHVASGVYFYKLVTKAYTQTKKMVLLK